MGHPPVSRQQIIARIQRRWASAPPWRNIRRTYAADDVVRLYRDDQDDLAAARQGAERLCAMIGRRIDAAPLRAMLARSSGQALEALNCGAGELCLIDAAQTGAAFSAAPAPLIDRVAHIALALHRSDRRQRREAPRAGDRPGLDYALPLLANLAEGGGSALDIYQAVQELLEAGIAGVVLDDHCHGRDGAPSEPTVPPDTLVQQLTAARMAADVAASETVLIVRTFAPAREDRTNRGLADLVDRASSWAPYADMVGLRSRGPDLQTAARFARAMREQFPHKPLCYDGPLGAGRAGREQLGALGYCLLLPEQTRVARRSQPAPPPQAAHRPLRGTFSC